MTAAWQTLIPSPSSDFQGPDTSSNNSGPNNLRNSINSTSFQSNQKNRLVNRVPCGEQIWRFYNGKIKSKQEGRRRILLKSGEVNSQLVNSLEKKERFFGDFFTTLVDTRWRIVLTVFSLSYLLSWFGFAIIWYIIIVAHGDIKHFGEENWSPCVVGVRSFSSVFLFSLETQHTIGFGHHRANDECPETIILLCIQSIIGVLIEALMVGVVLCKLSRPKKRSETIVFSNRAVICQRDGQLVLLFRIGDLRKSKILEAHVRAQIICKRTTAEGEVLPLSQEEIKVGGFKEIEDRILLLWPTEIIHPIDSESPLYSMSATDLLRSKIEIIVCMEGVVESTGMTTQARTSYLPSEILWGHRFAPMSSYRESLSSHQIDYAYFNSTFPVESPLCSAEDLDHIRQLKSEGHSGRDILASLSSSNKSEGGHPVKNGSDNEEDEDNSSKKIQQKRKTSFIEESLCQKGVLLGVSNEKEIGCIGCGEALLEERRISRKESSNSKLGSSCEVLEESLEIELGLGSDIEDEDEDENSDDAENNEDECERRETVSKRANRKHSSIGSSSVTSESNV